ncbi:MAG: S9 family peptidase [Bacteroidetes bacterium]|nr:S9 family peptidase [Bacteroidota bacterium]
MKQRNAILLIFVFLLTGCFSGEVDVPPPPASRVAVVSDTLHGEVIHDPYRWLENGRSEDTRLWIRAQNAYSDTILNQLPAREGLRRLITRLIEVDRVSCPREAGGRYYYTRLRGSEELPVLCMREGHDGREHVLVDPDLLSADHEISVEYMDISHDGKMIAYAVRRGGADETHIRFLDIRTGRDLPEILPTGRYFSVQFNHDHSGVYYVRHDAGGPRLLYHHLRNGMVSDQEIFGGSLGPEAAMWATLSQNGRWLLVSVAYGASGPIGLYLADLHQGLVFRRLVDDGRTRNYGVFAGDNLLIRTDDDAPGWRIMKTRCANAQRERWTEVVPQQKDAVIENLQPVGGRIAVQFLEDASYRVALYDLDGQKLRDIDVGMIGSISNLSGRWNSQEVFLGFSSFHIPEHVYCYDIESGEYSIWFRTEIPIDSDNFVIRRVRYPSSDGTEIPMFLVHKNGLKRNGDTPVLLYGYGGFGISMTPHFSVLAATIVQSGGIFALPNLRGGGEYGEAWHHAGMFERKQTVFDDFIAAAEFLIRDGYTRPERLGMYGAGNGGLLVGACMTQRPELFGVTVCTYPLLDMLRYHHFLVARLWVSEYGSSEDSVQFRSIKAYSPYHNVRSGVSYPAVMLITGDEDTRVDPLHARKMTALLQAETNGNTPVLLRYHQMTGHSGGHPKTKIIDELVDTFSFLAWGIGLTFNGGV